MPELDRTDSRFLKAYAVTFIIVIFMTLSFFETASSGEPVSYSITSRIDRLSSDIAMSDGKRAIELLLQRGELYRSAGLYNEAYDDFSDAMKRAEKIAPPAPYLEISTMQSKGYTSFLKGDIRESEVLLRKALEKSLHLDPPSPALSAICADHLGNLLATTGNREEAYTLYSKAVEQLHNQAPFLKDEKRTPGIEASLYRNMAHVATDDQAAATGYLLKAEELAGSITDLREKGLILLSIAAEATEREPGEAGDQLRFRLLDHSLAAALETGDKRLISMASGELGYLYESRQRTAEALSLTEQAVMASESIDNDELLVKWQWQWGRLLRIEGNRKQAIEACRRAIFYADSFLRDPTKSQAAYKDGCATMKERITPIYIALADMLLKESDSSVDENTRQKLFREVQRTIENIRQSEMRDYFKDPCIDALKREIQSLATTTAVIYPVIFDDRLEVLADIGSTLYRRTSGVKKERLDKVVTQLANNLRNGLFHEALGKEVYDWILAPFQSVFEANRVSTIVFVPDGVLRMIPPASLWTGEEFTAQKYAVVTEPGLTLLDPEPLPAGDRRTLLAGMSRPGPVISALPVNLKNQLSNADLSSFNRAVRGLSIKAASAYPEPYLNSSPSQKSGSNKILRESPANENKIKELLSLPGVDREIDNLSKTLHGKTMMNNDFLLDRFSGEIVNQNYRIVHVASHGFFGGSPDENFIMTYDKLLNMNLLEEFIKPKQFSDLPVELLTLSACQTAEGDEISPLGLSGVALKSGARSVLGSLWPVSDDATQLLLTSFYKNLNQKGMSKAKALQNAQNELLSKNEFRHPFYWSAFILVGNWL